jgi:hypothetical protein
MINSNVVATERCGECAAHAGALSDPFFIFVSLRLALGGGLFVGL